MGYVREILVLLLIFFAGLAVVYGFYRLAAAIFMPWLRRSGTMRSRSVSLFLCGVIATIVGLVTNQLDAANRGEAAALAIANGDTRTRIVRMEIDGQQRKVICTDTAVLRYLENCLRNCNRRELPGGYSYEMKLFFEDGSRFSCDSFWCEEGFKTRISGDPYFPPTHDVEMQDPIPDSVRKMIHFLNEMGFHRDARDVLILSSEE